MTVPTATGLDVLITVAGLIVLLAVGLYVAWRAEDRERRLERLRERRELTWSHKK